MEDVPFSHVSLQGRRFCLPTAVSIEICRDNRHNLQISIQSGPPVKDLLQFADDSGSTYRYSYCYKKTAGGKVVRSAGQPNACGKAVFETNFAPAFWIAFSSLSRERFLRVWRGAPSKRSQENTGYCKLHTGVALFTEILHITNSSHPACYRTCDWH